MSKTFSNIRFPVGSGNYFGSGPKMSFYLKGTANVVDGKGQYTNLQVIGHAGPDGVSSSISHYGYPVTVGLTIGGQYKETTIKFQDVGDWEGDHDETWNLGTISNVDLSGLIINSSNGYLPGTLYVRRWGSTTGGGANDTNTTGLSGYTRNIPMEIEALDMGAPTINGAPYYGASASSATINLTLGSAGRTAQGASYNPDSWNAQVRAVGGTEQDWTNATVSSSLDTSCVIETSYITNHQPFEVRVQGENSTHSAVSDWSSSYTINPNTAPIINRVTATPNTYNVDTPTTFSINFNYTDSDLNQQFVFTVSDGGSNTVTTTANPVSITFTPTTGSTTLTCSVSDGYDAVSTTIVVASVHDFQVVEPASGPTFTPYTALGQENGYSRKFGTATFTIQPNGYENNINCDVIIDYYVNGTLANSYVVATTSAVISAASSGTIIGTAVNDVDSIAVTQFGYNYSTDLTYKVRYKIYNALYSHEYSYPTTGYKSLARSPQIDEVYNNHANDWLDSSYQTHLYGRKFRITFEYPDTSLSSTQTLLTATDAIMTTSTTSQFITSLTLIWNNGYIDGTINSDLLFGGTISFKTSIPLADGTARKPISVSGLTICNALNVSEYNLFIDGINLTDFNIYAGSTSNSTLYCDWSTVFPDQNDIATARSANRLPEDFLQISVQGVSDSGKQAVYTITPAKDNNQSRFIATTSQNELATAIKTSSSVGTQFSGNQAFTLTPSIVNLYGVEFSFASRFNSLINHNTAPIVDSLTLISQEYHDEESTTIVPLAWGEDSYLVKNTDLTFNIYYTSQSSGNMTVDLEYSDDELTWYPYGSVIISVAGGYNATSVTPDEPLQILKDDTAPLILDGTNIKLRAKATLYGLTGTAASISNLTMVSLPKPVLNNLTLINDLDLGTVLTGEIYPSEISDNYPNFALYEVGTSPDDGATAVATFTHKNGNEYWFTLGAGLSGTVNCYAYYKILKPIEFDGQSFNISDYTTSSPMLLYTIVPTVIHRQNGVGINVSNLASTTVFAAKSLGSRINLLLSGTNHTVTLNLETGEITGLVLGSQFIDGGTWS